jgi:hypothetical protein
MTSRGAQTLTVDCWCYWSDLGIESLSMQVGERETGVRGVMTAMGLKDRYEPCLSLSAVHGSSCWLCWVPTALLLSQAAQARLVATCMLRHHVTCAAAPTGRL